MQRLMLMFAVLLLAVTPIFAQTDTVRVDFPPPVYDLAGTVRVVGTVNPQNLNSYFIEMGVYPDPTTWIPVSLPSRAPVTDGTLATIDTLLLPDGVYTLRLNVLLNTGEAQQVLIAPLRIANSLDGRETAPPIQLPPAIGNEPEAPPEPFEPVVIPRPQTVSDLPIPVGAQMDTFDEDAAELMRAAGMTWMKWQIPFTVGDRSLIDVVRDRINWSHERGFFVLLSVKGNKDELAAMGEDYFAEYAAFVGEISAMRPSAIQVWNEMNLDREWPLGQIDPRLYVALLEEAYNAIEAVDPEIIVVTGAPAPTGAEGAFGLDRVWNDDRYYLGMANAGAASFADCIGVHYNEGIISPRQQGGDPRGDYPTYYFPLMMQRAAFPFRTANMPLCFSELGYLSPDGFGQLPEGFAWGQNTSVAEQAEWLRDAIQIAATTDSTPVRFIIVFNANFTRFVDGDPQGAYAIIRPDGSCPACDAIAQLRSGGAG